MRAKSATAVPLPAGASQAITLRDSCAAQGALPLIMVRCADKKAANTCFRHDQDHLAHHGREAAKKALTDIRYHIGMLSRRYGDSQVGASKYVMHFTGFPVNDLQVCSDINGAVIPPGKAGAPRSWFIQ
jgi:hypothetical protein